MALEKPFSIRLTPKQFEAIHRLREETGLSTQELVRRAIDEYIDFQEAEARRAAAIARLPTGSGAPPALADKVTAPRTFKTPVRTR